MNFLHVRSHSAEKSIARNPSKIYDSLKVIVCPALFRHVQRTMEYQKLEDYLLAKIGSAKEFPFGPEAAVFKVAGKMFALVAWTEEPLRLTLKCEPEEADFLRSRFTAILPGYYMNKKHWNTVMLDHSIPEDLLLDMIEASYTLVVKGLPKADRKKITGG